MSRMWWPSGRGVLVVAAVSMLLTAAPLLAQEEETSAEPAVHAVRVAEGLRLDDPDAAFWRDAAETAVQTLGQTVVAPMQPEPAVGAVRVRAVHDGHFLAMRLEWDDPAADIDTVVDRFGDQVAVQFPVDPASEDQPMAMMGHAGAPVRILQWRAVLQHELEHGPPTIENLYPNAVVDTYPDRLLSSVLAQPYAGGRGLGNPVSRPRVLSPVVSHVSEGFGTLTATFDQEAGGRGLWRDGRWHVVITHPLARTGRTGLRSGSDTVVAFAVWDGGQREVGGRKAWTPWVPLRVDP